MSLILCDPGHITDPLWAAAWLASDEPCVLSPPDAVVKDTQPEDRQLDSEVSSVWS